MLASTRRRRPRVRLVVAMLSAVTAVATLGALSVAGNAAAAASTIVGVGSGRCLDVVGNVRTAETPVNIYDCNGQANQAWTSTPAGELKVYDDGTCLDVAGHDTTAPATVQIYPCTGGANQRWRINADGTITGVESGLCRTSRT